MAGYRVLGFGKGSNPEPKVKSMGNGMEIGFTEELSIGM